MILTCPSCSARYRLDPGRLGSEGRMVRCRSCGHSWYQAPPRAGEEPRELDRPVRAPFEADAPPAPAGRRDEDPLPPPPFRREPADAFRTPRRFEEERPRQGRGTFAILMVILLVLVVSIAAAAAILRDQIVAEWPGAAPLYAAVGLGPAEGSGQAAGATAAEEPAAPAAAASRLRLQDERVTQEQEAGRTVYVASGRIVNVSDLPVAVPMLRAQIMDASGRELAVESFAADAAEIAPAGSTVYTLRLRDIPPGAAQLLINFVEG